MRVGYGDREQRFHPNPRIMAAKTTLSASFADGQTVTRTTARAYTHVIRATPAFGSVVIAWTTDPIGAAKRETSRAASHGGGAVITDVVAVNA